MKKILSFAMAGVMMFSTLPMAYAADVDYTAGTNVSYNAEDPNGDGVLDNKEAYTVTVPAQLTPGESGNVIASGTWASNRKLTVTADANVVLTNSINAADKKTLVVTFDSIELAGSNTAAVSETKAVSVAEMPSDALFGTWSGHFEYTVELKAILNSFTLDESSVEGGTLATYQAEVGMTWAQWINSEYCPEGAYFINGNTVSHSAVAAENAICDEDGVQCSPDDVIKADSTYILF